MAPIGNMQNNLPSLQKSVRAEFEEQFVEKGIPGATNDSILYDLAPREFLDFLDKALLQACEATYTACLPEKITPDFKIFIRSGWNECREGFMAAYQQFIKGE